MRTQKKNQRGFTLMEILIVIGLIAVLAGIVLIAINPARQFAQARDTQRTSDLNAILNAVGQKMADNKGIFETGGCAPIDTSTSTIGNSGAANFIDLSCLVPTYISSLPMDPNGGTAADTKYKIVKDSAGRIKVFSDSEELTIPRSDDIVVIR